MTVPGRQPSEWAMSASLRSSQYRITSTARWRYGSSAMTSIDQLLNRVGGVVVAGAVPSEPGELSLVASMPVPTDIDGCRPQIALRLEHAAESWVQLRERVLCELLGDPIRSSQQMCEPDSCRVPITKEVIKLGRLTIIVIGQHGRRVFARNRHILLHTAHRQPVPSPASIRRRPSSSAASTSPPSGRLFDEVWWA